jgi:hypothetical protein
VYIKIFVSPVVLLSLIFIEEYIIQQYICIPIIVSEKQIHYSLGLINKNSFNKLKDNKIFLCFSHTQQYIILSYLDDDMFQSLDHHQTIFTELILMMTYFSHLTIIRPSLQNLYWWWHVSVTWPSSDHLYRTYIDDDMFQSLDHHQTIFTELRIRYMQCK